MISRNRIVYFIVLIGLYGCGCAEYLVEERNFFKSDYCIDKKFNRISNVRKLELIDDIKEALSTDMKNIQGAQENNTDYPKSKIGELVNNRFDKEHSEDMIKQHGNLMMLNSFLNRQSSIYKNDPHVAEEFKKAWNSFDAECMQYRYALEIKSPKITSEQFDIDEQDFTYQELKITYSNFSEEPMRYSIIKKPTQGKIKIIDGNSIMYKPNKGFSGEDSFRIVLLGNDYEYASRGILIK